VKVNRNKFVNSGGENREAENRQNRSGGNGKKNQSQPLDK
jgi:hypothetical protein